MAANGIPLFLLGRWHEQRRSIETPPHVAWLSRAMAERATGCPWDNGLPRYDKRRWSIGGLALFYALPGRNSGIRSVLGRRLPFWPGSIG